MFLRSGGRNQFAADSYKRDFPRVGISNSVIYAVGLLVALVIYSIIPQLVPDSVAYNTAQGLGFTNVEVVSRDWVLIQFRGCDRTDSVKFTVNGTNSAGTQQTFYVCAGPLKAGTPRFP